VKLDAELKAKYVGDTLDVKAASVKRRMQMEEDLQLDRDFKRRALGVLTQIENTLNNLQGGNSESRDGSEGKENNS